MMCAHLKHKSRFVFLRNCISVKDFHQSNKTRAGHGSFSVFSGASSVDVMKRWLWNLLMTLPRYNELLRTYDSIPEVSQVYNGSSLVTIS